MKGIKECLQWMFENEGKWLWSNKIKTVVRFESGNIEFASVEYAFSVKNVDALATEVNSTSFGLFKLYNWQPAEDEEEVKLIEGACKMKETLKFKDLEEATIDNRKVYVSNHGHKYMKVDGLPWSVDHNKYTALDVSDIASMTFEEVDEEKERLAEALVEALGVIQSYCSKIHGCELCKIKEWCDNYKDNSPQYWEF